MSLGLPGSTRITASGVVGVSGKPTRLWSASVISGGTASVLTLRNGSTSGGTTYDQIDGTASQSATKNWAGGLLFPGGIYVSVDGNISYAILNTTTESSS